MMQPTRDIMTIVGLFFILTIVDLLHHATTKFVSHTLHRETKKRGKFHSLALALTLTLTATLHPDHPTTTQCCRLQCNMNE